MCCLKRFSVQTRSNLNSHEIAIRFKSAFPPENKSHYLIGSVFLLAVPPTETLASPVRSSRKIKKGGFLVFEIENAPQETNVWMTEKRRLGKVWVAYGRWGKFKIWHQLVGKGFFLFFFWYCSLTQHTTEDVSRIYSRRSPQAVFEKSKGKVTERTLFCHVLFIFF